MNIWILNHYAVAPDSPGGTRHYDFAQCWVKQGHEVSIFASSFNHWDRANRFSSKEDFRTEMIGGVRFVWIRTPTYRRGYWKRALGMILFAWRALRASRAPAGRPDVVVGSSPHLLASFTGWLLAKRFKKPFVFEVRDLWPQSLVELGAWSSSPLVMLIGRLERFLYARASLLISMVVHIDRYLASKKIRAPKIVYIPNPVDLKRFSSAAGGSGSRVVSALQELHSQEKFVFGYLGAMGPANSLETLLKASSLLTSEEAQRIQVVFIGEGPSRVALERTAAAMRQIFFFPAVPREAVPEILREIDVPVFIVNPHLESTLGSPNKLLDYMAASKPVLCAARIPSKPIERSGGGVCVSPGEPAAIAEGMRKLAATPKAELLTMGEKGKEFVAREHDLNDLASRLLSALSELRKSNPMAHEIGKSAKQSGECVDPT